MSAQTIRINGPVVVCDHPGAFAMGDRVRVGEANLVGEVIRITADACFVQVYEDTTELRIGEPVISTGDALAVELGPGLLCSVFDGIQRPLEQLREQAGDTITRGLTVDPLSRSRRWSFEPLRQRGDRVQGGEILGRVQETPAVEHKILVPPGLKGCLSEIQPAGDYTLEDPVARIRDEAGHEQPVYLYQLWPVRRRRPVQERLAPDQPLVTGQRVIDTLFPIAKGGAAAMPGGFFSTLCSDSLGRPVLSIAHNGKDEQESSRLYTTFIQLDIEGNARAVLDARGNRVVAYRYDLLGHRVYERSMDAGERWMMNNVMGNPVHHWDAKGQRFTTTYDVIQRPIKTYLSLSTATGLYLIEAITYGEDVSNAQKRNLRGQSHQLLDSSGKLSTIRFDFKGNPLELQRQLAAAFEASVVDWSENAPTNRLETEVFTSAMEYDALNRVTRQYHWYRSDDRVTISEPRYNERNLLLAQDLISGAQRTEAGYFGGEHSTPVVEVTYDSKGQRRRLKLGNGTTTCYHYDEKTFRLIQLRTTRSSNNCRRPALPNPLADENVLQNLLYTYDPVGNILEIMDTAYEPVFFKNQKVEPGSRYTYDATYQLVGAEGRENLSRDTAPTAQETHPLAHQFPVTEKTLRNYTQSYTYDSVGNILKMRHTAPDERWTRRYAYHTDSNRLHQSWRGNYNAEAVTYQYDVHGNMLNYHNTPDEFLPQWDYEDRIRRIDLGGGGQAYYQYDTSLERSRKRIIRQEDIIEERLYLGGMELYRRWNETGLLEEIETHHVMMNDQRVLLLEEVIQTDSDLPTGLLFRYQYSNHLGSSSLELNEAGVIISYEEYHPYGTAAYRAVNSDVKATKKRYRYTGMERDEESGLNYHSARYYLPWLGRWGSVDPLGLGGGINSYRYSNANSITFFDKNGLKANNEDGQVANQAISLQIDEEQIVVVKDIDEIGFDFDFSNEDEGYTPQDFMNLPALDLRKETGFDFELSTELNADVDILIEEEFYGYLTLDVPNRVLNFGFRVGINSADQPFVAFRLGFALSSTPMTLTFSPYSEQYGGDPTALLMFGEYIEGRLGSYYGLLTFGPSQFIGTNLFSDGTYSTYSGTEPASTFQGTSIPLGFTGHNTAGAQVGSEFVLNLSELSDFMLSVTPKRPINPYGRMRGTGYSGF